MKTKCHGAEHKGKDVAQDYEVDCRKVNKLMKENEKLKEIMRKYV